MGIGGSMQFHADEWALADAWTRTTRFEGLAPEQVRSVAQKAADLQRWFHAHPRLHSLLTFSVLSGLLVLDALVLLRLPAVCLGPAASTPRLLLSALAVGALHSWLIYSLVVYTVHEGAAHGLLFPLPGRLGRLLNGIGNNLCRLGSADPTHYVANHRSHHASFGTPQDGEFLNFVAPRRYWPMLLPFGMFLNYSDFVVHRPLRFTRSRLLSATLAVSYNVAYGVVLAQRHGDLFAAVSLALVLPHAGFYLDRLRQFTEHNLMPIENRHGARSFGVGFWGLLVGGGPWGQPCHWMHHLAPGLPWYQQVRLHRHVARLLTPEQRREFLIAPVLGFPRLVLRLWRETAALARQASAVEPLGATTPAHGALAAVADPQPAARG